VPGIKSPLALGREAIHHTRGARTATAPLNRNGTCNPTADADARFEEHLTRLKEE
jgi:hypothetical protein